MFIKAVKTYTKKNGEPQFSCRLVHNQRIGSKIKQHTLLNLGSKWPVDKSLWPAISQRIQEILDGQLELFDVDPQVERQAVSIVSRLRARGWPQTDTTSGASAEIQLDSLEHQQPRTAGGERMCLKALQDVGWFELLKTLNVTQRDAKLSAALVIGRMLHPSSEREALRWMLEDSAIFEMLELEQHLAPSLNKLYRLNDLLWKHREGLLQGLFERTQELFSTPSTVVFYDLTNVHYHGRSNDTLVCYGRSKQKRNDCPLISMALALDAAGFPCHCEILPGNVTEAKTLQQMLTKLQSQTAGEQARPSVVMDAGIATNDNVKWLGEQGYSWIVVSRQAKPEAPQGEPDVTLLSSAKSLVRGWKLARAEDEKEVKLYVHSEHKKHGDESILRRQRQLFEKALQELHSGLSKPYYVKRVGKVHERIGRLKQKYPKVASHYQVKVTADKNDFNATAVHYHYKPKHSKADEHAGSYVLRTSHVEWSAEDIIRSYWKLSDLESTFRALKSELGLRPIWHQRDRRICAHLMISVLAYYAVQWLRMHLQGEKINLSWDSIRTRMRSWLRITTTMKEVNGASIVNRQDVRPSAEALQIARALGMKMQLHRHRIRSE